MLNKIYAFIMILLLFATSANAQDTESVLWEISGKNLKTKSYLFGTFHTVSVKLIDSFPRLKNIIRKCDYGLFEQGNNAIGNVKYINIETPALDAIFTKEEYELVDNFFTNSSYGSIRLHNKDAL
jgi:hypothetical protein